MYVPPSRYSFHALVFGGYPPILPPPGLRTATTDGLGGVPSLKSGQRVAGSSKVEARSKPGNFLVPSVPGRCTARNTVSESGVKHGPHISAPIGTLKNNFEVARASPSVSMA
jgi:hypothetical protein